MFFVHNWKKNCFQKINLSNNCGIIPSLIENKIIVWDNLYCNDYCPRKLFVGKWKSRDSNINIMLNGTGLFETDKLLLNLIKVENNNQNWEKTILKFKIPSYFLTFQCFLINLSLDSKKLKENLMKKNSLNQLITYCGNGKSTSLEWYPYLLGLKQDYLIYKKKLKIKRIRKTQTFFSYINRKQK